jgi:hypothetical protein
MSQLHKIVGSLSLGTLTNAAPKEALSQESIDSLSLSFSLLDSIVIVTKLCRMGRPRHPNKIVFINQADSLPI